ncbi:MAG: hypothetical protein J3Q66DRAFT_393082 [Benniella sp.]|nr:MAG: hypothetical protein J3Q66DRAFT_393082 [Benniella sp.]
MILLDTPLQGVASSTLRLSSLSHLVSTLTGLFRQHGPRQPPTLPKATIVEYYDSAGQTVDNKGVDKSIGGKDRMRGQDKREGCAATSSTFSDTEYANRVHEVYGGYCSIGYSYD